MKASRSRTKQRRSKRPAMPPELRSSVAWRGYDNIAGLLVPEEVAKEHNRKAFEKADIDVRRELVAKLPVLARHLGISPYEDGWQTELCLQLAAKSYPGFRVVDKKFGRPPKWDSERYMQLLCDVEAVKREHEQNGRSRPTDSEALVHLINRSSSGTGDRYILKPGQTREACHKTLKNRFVEAADRKKNPFGAVVWNHPDEELRSAIFDQWLPVFASPGKV
jgi:hypothetical protein